MPLGNGDIGLNVWIEEGGDLLFYISKADAFDGDHVSRESWAGFAWPSNPILLPPGCRSVKPWICTKPASSVQAGKPGEAVTLEVWVDANHPVIHVRGRSDLPIEAKVSLESIRAQRQVERSGVSLCTTRTSGRATGRQGGSAALVLPQRKLGVVGAVGAGGLGRVGEENERPAVAPDLRRAGPRSGPRASLTQRAGNGRQDQHAGPLDPRSERTDRHDGPVAGPIGYSKRRRRTASIRRKRGRPTANGGAISGTAATSLWAGANQQRRSPRATRSNGLFRPAPAAERSRSSSTARSSRWTCRPAPMPSAGRAAEPSMPTTAIGTACRSCGRIPGCPIGR